MIDGIDLLILLASVVYFTYVLRYTDGIFDIFYKMRRICRFETYIDDEGVEVEYATNSVLSKLIDCWWCLTFWVSLFITACYGHTDTTEFTLIWFGLSGTSGMVYKLFIEED